jgi:hypothetical protein
MEIFFMAGQKGFIYEKNIYDILLKEQLTNSKYRPAQADNMKPDTAFKVGDKFYNLEVKLDMSTDFGQGTLRYDFNKKEWFTYAESSKMKELLDYYKVADFANKEWTKMPNKVNKNDIGRTAKTTLTPAQIKEDTVNFPDKYLRLSGRNSIAEYYNSKDIYYIQIGDFYGFYYMGEDKAKLGVPEFNPREQKIRIRRKGSGGGNYRFTTAIVISKDLKRSNYDLDRDLNFIINASR